MEEQLKDIFAKQPIDWTQADLSIILAANNQLGRDAVRTIYNQRIS